MKLKKVFLICMIILQLVVIQKSKEKCFATENDNVNIEEVSLSVANNYNKSFENSALKNKLQGTNPIKFHLDVPPGNYDVTVELGDKYTSASTSVEGEARRAMIGETYTRSGHILKRKFTINVREPEAQPTGEGGNGIPGLDITFLGQSPKVNGIKVAAAKKSQMVYLVGDSTVCDRLAAPYAGWGEMIPQYFKSHTCIANYADCGESSSTFLNTATLFPYIKQILKPNDYVLIQFGHNDKTSTADEYSNNLNTYVSECRKVGAIPVLVTPPVRRNFNSDNKTLSDTSLHVNSFGVNLPGIMKEVAIKNNVPLIDLTSKSKELVESLGIDGCKKLYLTMEDDGIEDHTHFSEYGANEMAKLVVQEIKELKIPITSKLR
ncbi:rhamnogalacturonan acetylesterase [Clostridium sp. SHJSY1]|uniref:rhamnogalacturonan acetylesterase n=1 Tax=Clostridium sp. SHJSY1 TaxID=2942483 RepID=UPI002875B688|nr:rhamnogalacturonan acetylesterase [Clostridium sp. SHJSY1]MDS0526300.1 rhamnogalacturonan acetylesterase [Clostridium sp. SHJSY1]